MELSEKQLKLINDIKSRDVPEISVLGSVQSGKTFSIDLGLILYASELHKYDNTRDFYGAIIRLGFTNNKRKYNRAIKNTFR